MDTVFKARKQSLAEDSKVLFRHSWKLEHDQRQCLDICNILRTTAEKLRNLINTTHSYQDLALINGHLYHVSYVRLNMTMIEDMPPDTQLLVSMRVNFVSGFKVLLVMHNTRMTEEQYAIYKDFVFS